MTTTDERLSTRWSPENVARRMIWKLRDGHSLSLEEMGGFPGASEDSIVFGLRLALLHGYVEEAAQIGDTTLYKITERGEAIAEFIGHSRTIRSNVDEAWR